MNRDEDHEYQLHDDELLAAIPPDEWRRRVAADTERIRLNHARQAEILRRRQL